MDKQELKKELSKLFISEKKKWIAAGCPRENKEAVSMIDRYKGWCFSYDRFDFEVNWSRDLGIMGHCSTRVVIRLRGYANCNIYCWDYWDNKRVIEYMSRWMMKFM